MKQSLRLFVASAKQSEKTSMTFSFTKPPPKMDTDEFRVRVSSILPLFFFSFFFLALISSTSSSKIPYSTHCGSLVPESATTIPIAGPTAAFRFSAGYFTGGDRILSPDRNSTVTIPKSLSFRPRSLHQTLDSNTLKVAGTLVLRGGGIRVASHRHDRGLRFRISPRIPRSFYQRGVVSFNLEGFWSGSSGRLCMVGTGNTRSKEGISLQLSAVFKLNYPNSSNVTSSVVAGIVESVDDVSNLNYFNPIRVLTYAQKDYVFTKVSEAVGMCSSAVRVEEELLGFENNETCHYLNRHMMNGFRLEYGTACLGHYCGPFDRGFGFSPSFMRFNEVQCSRDGMLRMYLTFWNGGSLGGPSRMMVPQRGLVGEGVWDPEKKRLCLVACRILNVSSSLSQATVDDCTIGLSLWFPSALSIEHMNMASGQIWSSRDKNDPKYFGMISIGSVGDLNNHVVGIPGVKYNYTQIDRVQKFCVRDVNTRKIGDRRYPNMNSYLQDVRFSMHLTNADGKNAWGYANPVFIGENFYRRFSPLLVEHNQSIWNVSYKIGYTFDKVSPVHAYQANAEISAEGTYDAQTGTLCMVGCRDSYLDCEILINIQFPPLNPKEKGEHLTGTIKSIRKNSDPLFFKPLKISSYGMYIPQADEAIRWMVAEIIMVLISLTLSCIFIVLQLFHIKKNPDVLPSISVTTLAVLTLGYMIPLVLNFEALFFRDHNQQNFLLLGSGWLQVNSVVVRALTLVAFLLQLFLLQAAWSSRLAGEDKKGLWVTEKKTLLLCCLPLYAIGGLIVLLVHIMSFSTQHQHSLWVDLMSFAGFILDNFLLPQFILNIFSNSKNTSLAPSFYVGITFVRALPHLYDAYRARHYVPRLNPRYIYANLDGDLYSSVWDIIIPCEGLVLVVLIYLQQRFGGTFIIARKIKEPAVYEMVPVVSH